MKKLIWIVIAIAGAIALAGVAGVWYGYLFLNRPMILHESITTEGSI